MMIDSQRRQKHTKKKSSIIYNEEDEKGDRKERKEIHKAEKVTIHIQLYTSQEKKMTKRQFNSTGIFITKTLILVSKR